MYDRKLKKKVEKKKKMEEQIAVKRTAILELKKQETSLEESTGKDSYKVIEKEKELEEAMREIAEIESQIRSFENQMTQLHAQIQSQSERLGMTQNEAKSQKYRLDSNKETLLMEKSELLKKQQQKQSALENSKLLLDHYQMLRNNMNPKSIKEIIQRKIESLNGNLEGIEKSQKETLADIERYTKDLKEKEREIKLIREQVESSRDENDEIIGNMQDLDKEKNKIQTDSLNIKIALSSTKQKLSELQSEFSQLRKKFEVGFSEINVSGIVVLMEEIERSRVEGVYGLFVDLISADESILFSLEALLKGKLFSIVVKDHLVAEAVIEINKRIKGPKITIYPVNWSNENQRVIDYPSDQNAIVFEKFIKPREEYEDAGLEPLIKNLVGGNLMVRTLEEAQKFAKKYDCNCISFDGEIVFAGAFLTKLGYTDKKNDRLKNYLEYRVLTRELESQVRIFSKMSKDAESLKDQEDVIHKKVSELRIEKERIRIKTENLLGELVTYEKACIQVKKILVELENRGYSEEEQVSHTKQEIAQLKSKDGIMKIDKFDETKFKEVTKEIEKLVKDYNEIMEEIQKNDQDVAAIEQENEKLAENIQKDVYNKKENSSLEVDMMNLEVKRLKTLLDSLKKFQKERLGFMKGLKDNVENQKTTNSREEESLKKVKSILEEAQLELQVENQQKFDLQIAIDSLQSKMIVLNVNTEIDSNELRELVKKSDKELIQKLKRLMLNKIKYTEKDKANFERLEEYFKDLNEYDAELRDLKASKSTFLSLLSKFY